MKMKMKISFGIAALAAATTIGFVPANAHKEQAGLPGASFAMVTGVLASPETPQDLVWDMTYGWERAVADEESVASVESEIVDYTFG